MFPKSVYWTLLLAICAYALWRGRNDERVAALTALGASVANRFVLSPTVTRYSGLEGGVLAVDVAVFLVFTALALQSRRFWPLWIAGLQLTTLLGHLLKVVDFSLFPYAYGAALRFWSYPILLIIAVGTWRGQRRARHQDRGTVAA